MVIRLKTQLFFYNINLNLKNNNNKKPFFNIHYYSNSFVRILRNFKIQKINKL